jgi:DNA polymerase III subunit delta'
MTLADWNIEAWHNLMQRRRGGTLPHALLLSGPEGLGKREFADALARAMLCQSVLADGHACGACRACKLCDAGTHPDLARIGLELRDDGKRRTEITVDQMRNLSERLTLTAQFGGGQIALIDPADTMNVSASNALLKTLEEPTPGTLIVLIADYPARLSATIRSRCQRLNFRIPAAAPAQSWLMAQGIEAAAARRALDASGGNPGQALLWSRGGGLKLRDEVARDLRELRSGGNAFDVAQRWSRDEVDLRLLFAAALVAQESRAQALGHHGPLALTATTDFTKLATWFTDANRMRDLLRGPLRADLSLLELLAAWSRGSVAGAMKA